jgi:hypothetical protein
VDTLLALSDVDSLAAHTDGEKFGTVSITHYLAEDGLATGEHIALLVAEGDIVDGRSREGPFGGGRSVGIARWSRRSRRSASRSRSERSCCASTAPAVRATPRTPCGRS